MAEPEAVAPEGRKISPGGVGVLVLTGLMIVAATVIVYRDALGFQLMGDDYQWWQHAHAAMHRPALLLADLDTFYRPASTWTLVLDRLVLGDSPAGFHLTNLLLHGVAGCLLLLVGRRLGLAPVEAAAVGLAWVLSPFTEEPAVSVAIRFQDLLLMAWLGLLLAWPGRGQKMTRGRLGAITGLTLLAAASKETWVMTAALVPALEAAADRWETRDWIRRAVPLALAAAAYTGIYFLVFPGGKGYFSFDPRVLFKIPHQLAVFLALEPLAPSAFPLSWYGVLATVAVTGLLILGWRRRVPAMIVGSALLFVPMVPTFLVPFLPTRYTAVPYAGFLLFVVGWIAWLRGSTHGRRWIVTTVEAAALAALLLTGVGTVRADLQGDAMVSDAHLRLLEETRRVMPQVPLDRPIVMVRGERDNLLAQIGQEPGSLAKPRFIRGKDPYGLIDAAALFEWVLHRESVAFRPVSEASVQGVPGAVLVHRVGGFQWLEDQVDDTGLAVASWRASCLPYRIIRAVPLQ